MKPKRLEFCGINSFSRKAGIDFDRLLAGGIFGIFGDTGSGKTTILDSMIFALYGKVDRVRDGAAADLINYGCDRAYAVFEFETGSGGKRSVYRIEREIRRKNSAQSLRLSEIRDGREIAVSEGVKNTNAKIEEIVGLTFDEFKKCIALPQGEFARFLKESKSERLKLISHLFGLERYGSRLGERLKERYAQARSAYDLKAGELKGYEEVEPGSAAKLRAELANLLEQKQVLDAEYGKFRAAYEALCAEYKRGEEAAALQKELDALRADEQQAAARKERIKKYPTAREIALALQRRKAREAREAKASAALAAAEAEKSAALAAEAELKKRFDPEKSARELDELTAKAALLARAKDDAETLARDRAECKKRTDERNAAQKKCAEAKAELERCSQRERVLAAEAEKFGEQSLEELLRHDLDSALLAGEYRSMRGYFGEKQAQLRREFTGGELYERVDAELSAQIARYDGLLTAQKTDDAALLLEKFRAAQQEKTAYTAACNKTALEKSRAASALAEAQAAEAHAADAALQAAERAARAEKDLRAALGGEEDVAAYEKKIAARRAAAEQEKLLFTQKTGALAEQVKKAERELAAAGAELAGCKREQEEEEQKLQTLLAAAGFISEEEASALLAAVGDPQEEERALAARDAKLLSVQAKLSMLTEQGIRRIGAEELAARKAEADALEERKQAAEKSAAVYESRIAELEVREKKKKQLEKEFSSAKSELELVAKLRDLLRGNGLTEFIAGEYLSDISAAATKTLLKLTSGRYFIRYDQGFLVGDNLCGGELRGVNTLSGGETFLVSLSLALALSSAIYARSLKPIEFFFLDEGFGTLDEKLIDTVMDSLEKLKDSHFSIGLISHVDELRHRIRSKILVTGAAENGSSAVAFSY